MHVALGALCLLVAYQTTHSYFIGNGEAFESAALKYAGFALLNRSGVSVASTSTSITAVFHDDYRVLDLLLMLVPDFGQTAPAKTSDSPLNFKIRNFEVDIDSGDWSIGTKEFPTWTIEKNVLAVSNVTASIRIHVDPTATEKVSIRGFDIAGTVRIGRTGMDLKFSQVGPNLYFLGAPTSGSIPVGSFVEWLGSKILPDALEEPLRKIGLERFTIEKARVVGTYGPSGFAFGVSGTPTIARWGGFRCHFIATRYAALSYQRARTVYTFAIDLPRFELAGLVRTLTGGSVDLRDVPVLGSLTVPETGVVVSSDNVVPNFLPHLLDGNVRNAISSYIPQGVSVVAEIPFVSDQPAVVFLLKLGADAVSFSIRDPGRSLTLGNLINAVVPDFHVNELDVPQGVSDLLDVQMTRFDLITKPMTLAAEFRLDSQIDVIPGYFSIVNPSIDITMKLSKPRSFEFQAGGYLKFGSGDFDVQIRQAPSGKGFVITAQHTEIDIGKIIEKFNANFLPSTLSSALEAASMIDFKILEPHLSVEVAENFQVEFSGRPQIAGWDGVRLSGVVSKTTESVVMAGGFEFSNIGFASVVKKLTGVDVTALKLLDQSLRVAAIISPESMPGVRLRGEILEKISIKRGLSLVALFSFPSNCEGDRLCEFGKGTIGANASFQLEATIGSVSQFEISAGVDNVRLSDLIELRECALFFDVGLETSAGIRATLALSDPQLEFTGELSGGVEGITFRFTMQGLWKRAFGISYLTLGNAILSGSLEPVYPFLTALELGASLSLGRLEVDVYVGLDVVDPLQNYFYGSVNRSLTMSDVLGAFHSNVALPRVVAESGFPDGLRVSYSTTSRVLSPSDISIPQGIVIKGSVQILGFRLTADIEVNLPKSVKIMVAMTPLNLADGRIKIFKSSIDRSNGPLLDIDMKVDDVPSINVVANGYVSILGGMIESEEQLLITNSQFVLNLRGALFVFEASLSIYASYGSLRAASFRVSGSIASRSLDALDKDASHIIETGANDATHRVRKAEERNNSASSFFESTAGKLHQARNKVNALCRIRKCECSWFLCVNKLACYAANAACHTERAIVYGALTLAEKAVEGASAALDTAKAIYEDVKAAARVGLEAAAAIVAHTLSGLIDIKRMEFDVAIGLLESGYVKARIHVSFLRRRETALDFNVHLRSIRDMALDLADAVFPGITGRSRRDVTARLRRALPGYSRRHYLPSQYVRRPGVDEVAAVSRRQRERRIVSGGSGIRANFKALAWSELRSQRAFRHAQRYMNAVLTRAELFKNRLMATANESLIPVHHFHVLDVDNDRAIIVSAQEKCQQYHRLQSVLRQLPDTVEIEYRRLALLKRIFNARSDSYNHAFEEAELDRITATNHSREALEVVGNISKEHRKVESESDGKLEAVALETEELIRNATNLERREDEVYSKVREVLQLWNSTVAHQMTEQYINGVKLIAAPLRQKILKKTGLSFEDYTVHVVNKISELYEEIDTSDTRYANASAIVSGLDVIRNKLLLLPMQTLEQAKKAADETLAELHVMEETKVYCQSYN